MIPIFNELEYARKMNNGDSETRSHNEKRRYTYQELLVYTKWLRWEIYGKTLKVIDEQSKEEKIREGLVSFCEQLQLNFNQEIDYKIIENLIKDSKKYYLRDNKPVIITVNEWNKILEIPDENARKLYFALLVIGKFNRYNPVKMSIKRKPIIYTDSRLRISANMNELYRYIGIKFPRGCQKNNSNLFYSPLTCLVNLKLIEIPNLFILITRGCKIILNFAELEDNITKDNIYMKIYDCGKAENYYHYGMKEPRYDLCKDCNVAYKKIFKDSERCYSCEVKYNKTNNIRYELCEKCGKRIEITGTTQTNLCPECYNKTRRQNKTRDMKKINKKHVKESLISNCKNCGKEIIISGKTQTNLCEKCYNEIRNKNQAKTKTDYDNKHRKKKTIISNCEKCGKEILVSGNTKLLLCDECKKEYQRENKRLTMQNLRLKQKDDLKKE